MPRPGPERLSSPTVLAAVVFDVDGTLADTERDGHRPAFNRAFAAHGLPYAWDEETYGRLLAIPGGRPRLEHFLDEQGQPDAAGWAEVLHATKTDAFLEWVHHGPVQARPGVPELVSDLRARGVRCGVATTGRRAWVEPLLARLVDPGTFSVVVAGDDVTDLKPDPEAYHRAVAALGVAPGTVLAVEDSPPGLAAARAGGLACLVVVNGYTRGEDFPGAAAVLDSFHELDAARCASFLGMSG